MTVQRAARAQTVLDYLAASKKARAASNAYLTASHAAADAAWAAYIIAADAENAAEDAVRKLDKANAS